MPSSLPRELPSLWLRIWIGVGVAALLLMIIAPIVIFSYTAKELDRKQACDRGQSDNCEPTFIWVLSDAAKEAAQKAENVAQGTGDGASVNGERRMGTSENAPYVDSVDIGGATFQDNWYFAPAGSDLHLTAVVSGDPQSVEVYAIPKGTETVGVGTHIAAMNKTADGLYELTYTVPAGLYADLEFRAVAGPNEYGSLLVSIREQK